MRLPSSQLQGQLSWYRWGCLQLTASLLTSSMSPFTGGGGGGDDHTPRLLVETEGAVSVLSASAVFA